MKYTQRKDGEGWSIPKVQGHAITRLACCDCGLVHDIVLINGKNYIGIAAKRNNRATAQRRRKKP